MAGFPNIRLTSKGGDIIAKANASHKAIEFTKVVLGDGLLETQNIEGLTSLISEKMVLSVTGGRQVSNDTWSVTAVMDNNNINTGFYVREVGLYARVAGGAEALYAYTNAGNQCDYLPSKENPHQQEITITYAVRNAETVNIIVDGTVYITKKQLDDHNADPSAHAHIQGLVQNLTNKVNGIPISNILNAVDVIGALNSQTLSSLGVRYSLGENGYVCFGKLFGGLIIQWGNSRFNAEGNCAVTFPLAFPTRFYVFTTPDVYSQTLSDWGINRSTSSTGLSSVNLHARFYNGNVATGGSFSWFAIGY